MDEPTTLYRHFNAEGQLLYVGISLYPFSRLEAHRSGSRWFKEIVQITLERFETREAAHDAEREAVRHENPLNNVIRFEGSVPIPRKEWPRTRVWEILDYVHDLSACRLYTVEFAASVFGMPEERMQRLIVGTQPGECVSRSDMLVLCDRLYHQVEQTAPPWALGAPYATGLTEQYPQHGRTS